MKKLSMILFALLAFCIHLKAQFVYKVEPKVFTNEMTGNNFLITGIHAVVLGGTECSLDSTLNKTLFLEFVVKNVADSTVSTIGQQTVTSTEIVKILIKSGSSSPQNSVLTIFRNLEYGTREERFDAAWLLASFYNYTLKPINEQ